MEQIFFSLPLRDLEPIIKKWVKEAHQDIKPDESSRPNQPEKLLSAQEAAIFLGLSISTIYTKVSRRELPHVKKGKRLYFSATELSDYLNSGRCLTASQVDSNAHLFLKRKEGKDE